MTVGNDSSTATAFASGIKPSKFNLQRIQCNEHSVAQGNVLDNNKIGRGSFEARVAPCRSRFTHEHPLICVDVVRIGPLSTMVHHHGTWHVPPLRQTVDCGHFCVWAIHQQAHRLPPPAPSAADMTTPGEQAERRLCRPRHPTSRYERSSF